MHFSQDRNSHYILTSSLLPSTFPLFIVIWCFLLRLILLSGGPHLLTQCDTVDLWPLGVRLVPVHLLYNLLLHLRDGVTVQHLDGRHIRTLTLHQHLQGLANKHTQIITPTISPRGYGVCAETRAPTHTDKKYAEIFKHGQSTQPATHPQTHTRTLWRDVVVMATRFL